MGLYKQMLADLERREAELMAELKNVKALQAAVKPLASTDNSEAIRPATQPLAVQTVGPPQPETFPRIKMFTQRRTLADLAYQALQDAGQPLPLKQLIEAVRQMGGGKDQTVGQLRASLVPTLRRRKEFTSERRGFYGLQKWKVERAS